MSDTNDQRYLLPAGLRDGLPPDAGFEAAMVERLMANFASWGYERVKPPLIEFEDSLLSGPGEAMSAHTFRLMDPVSQRMMGLRADMTPQVGRIAASRLRNAARPLRLSYAGQVLRIKGEQMRPERQIGQAGVELIGASNAAADAEVVLLAAESLRNLGVVDLAVDLNVPTLTPSLLRHHGVADPMPLILALDRKDAAAIREMDGAVARILDVLLRAVGSAGQAVPLLRSLDLPQEAALQRDRLVEVVELVATAAPDLPLTIDPTDHRGFEYHSGVTFSILGRGVKGEFGRGGRYVNQAGEVATGFTLYLDTLLSALPMPEPQRRVFVPHEAKASIAAELRRQGWVTIHGLSTEGDACLEAKSQRCTHIWAGNGIEALD